MSQEKVRIGKSTGVGRVPDTLTDSENKSRGRSHSPGAGDTDTTRYSVDWEVVTRDKVSPPSFTLFFSTT